MSKNTHLNENQERQSRHRYRKTRPKQQQIKQKQLIEYIDKNESQALQNIYQRQKQIMSGHYKLGIWRKNMNLLSKNHLPIYIKLLNFQTNQACLIPSRANVNQKKNYKSDFFIDDPISSKTKLIKMDSFPILFTPQQMAFYSLSFSQFQTMFNCFQITKEDIKKVYHYLIQQNENIHNNDKNVLWPIVILEGLNYNFDEIYKIMSNFIINKNQNYLLFQNMIKIVNQTSFNNIKQQQLVQPHIISWEEERVNVNENKEIIKQIQKQTNTMIKTQNKFCIWLIGTAEFIFTNKNIINWHTFSKQNIKNLSTGLLGINLIKQTNLIIDSLNKHKKLRDAQLKADQYKYFIYRLGYYKQNQQLELFCIPLRFQNVKGTGKRVLIRVLTVGSTQLKWVPTQTCTVNYNLPLLTKKQMNFMYLVKKLSSLEIIKRYFYRQYLLLSHQDISQVFLSFFPQFFTSQQQAYHQRCKACNYVIRDMTFKCCFFCQTFCHQECAIEIRKKTSNGFFQQLFSSFQEVPWICQKCQPCSVCSEAVGNQFLFCSTCFSYSHFECGRIKGLQENQLKIKNFKVNDKHVCQFCLKCKMCSRKLKDNEYLLMQNQFYCGDCSDKIKSNNHCHVCMKKKEGNSSMKWIQCGEIQCEKWVHEICDPLYMKVVKSPTADDPYLCPFCRQIQTRKVYVQIIDCISVFDEAQFFTQPSYQRIPLYNTIISQPMCFMIMKQKAFEGKYDKDTYKKIEQDFQLIINNALKFNMPKDTAHVQAKILKILGQKALQKFSQLFNPQLTSLITGGAFEQIKRLKLQLHRQINTHYLQILLNYKAQKSFIEVRQNKRKTNQFKLEDQLKFRSVQILNNLFKNSSLVFHLRKQKIRIQNLFTMPKNQNQRGIWHAIKGNLCYYHNNSDIIYTCEECGESYCCLKECLRHRICTACSQKQCKCDSYDCGCQQLKEKQKKMIEKLILKYAQPMRTYKQVMMSLTENFKYCLKCASDKINTRLCTGCQGLCSWGYFCCPDCNKVWHKKCYPQLLHVKYVGNFFIPNQKMQESTPAQSNQQINGLNYANSSSKTNASANSPPIKSPMANYMQQTPTCSVFYCNDCLSNNHPNTYQHALTLSAKSRLVKISKITHYMRIFMQVYFNEGIRLTPYQIQQLILENYDQFSIRESLFKQYQLNHQIIQRFRDYNFKANSAIQGYFVEYVNDNIQTKRVFLQSADDNYNSCELADNLQFLEKCKRIWKKYRPIFNKNYIDERKIQQFTNEHNEQDDNLQTSPWKQRFYFKTILQLRQKILLNAYTYPDYYSYKNKKQSQTKAILTLTQPYQTQILNCHKNIVNNNITSFDWQSYSSFNSIDEYKSYFQSLNYIPSIIQAFYKNQHRYRFSLIYYPRSMPFYYTLNPTFKKKNSLQQATKQFLFGIYQESKHCLRKGTTCIIKYSNGNKDAKDYWSVLKKWAKGNRQMQITLQKKIGLWFLKIDNRNQIIVHEIQQVWNQINKYYLQGKITSFKQLGEFLGFTIFQPFYKANHFTNFLQTNLVDEMPLLDRMNKITQLYESFNWGQNGIFTKPGPALPSNFQIPDSTFVQKIVNYQYSINNFKPQYLTKKRKKNVEKFPTKLDKKASVSAQMDGNQNNNNLNQLDNNRKVPFITFEDLKRYLIDFSVLNPIKSQISIKNSQIVNEVFIAPSKIHKLGLFSRKFIKKNSIVTQYIGEIVSESIADLREKKFHYGCYLFSILKQNQKQSQDKKDIIDATFRGNMARYINHSCDVIVCQSSPIVRQEPNILMDGQELLSIPLEIYNNFNKLPMIISLMLMLWKNYNVLVELKIVKEGQIEILIILTDTYNLQPSLLLRSVTI